MIEKPKFSISFSEYSTFQQCPHKWFLNYCLKIGSGSGEELIFGSAVHNTIESMLTKPVFKAMANNINVVEGIFKNELKKQIMDVQDLIFLKKIQEGWVAPTFIKQAKGLLEELNIFKRFEDYEFVDVEIKLDGMPIVETDDVILTYKGFIDLVLRHKETGRYLIVDWKTSRKKWDINAKELDTNFYTQLKLYKHFYALNKGIPLDMIDLAFYNLPREEPRDQKFYYKSFTDTEISDFMSEFSSKCMEIYEFDHFTLNKMRFTHKKNYCSRCAYNSITLCNQTDQFQTVGPQ